MTESILHAAEEVWAGRAPLAELAGHSAMAAPEEVADGVFMVPGFSHSFAVRHDEGLLLFDTGSAMLADNLHRAVRGWSDAPVTHAVFSHGHADHVFGLGPFEAAGDAPVVVAHENVAKRFDRYVRTNGYNGIINRRQFQMPDLTWPTEYRHPDVTFTDSHRIEVGGVVLELTHHRGETDDHAVGWLPDRKILFPGDLFIGLAPNAGNPQKVQRFPEEWAAALRWMASLGAELMLGSHGVPIVGAARIREALENSAAYLESLVEQTLECLNEGATLVEAVHRVRVPEELAGLHYLQPLYDEPEFVVRNVWRLHGGWYDGNPARLKPAPDEALAGELAELCGGAEVLAERATALAEEGSLRLACHLAQLAGDAAPDSATVQRARKQVYATRADSERSTMSKGIFSWAASESDTALAKLRG
ncbi:alkyl sulfatase dimerization domain-containing protein [Saccharopolyspora sp. MS10]|uniref:alkyl sulfatase dimerization domain-containing protein n=1 Tax=Saccharopolyspora sp. MS10 TaxID=3385973 RepID=UPI00399F6A5C